MAATLAQEIKSSRIYVTPNTAFVRRLIAQVQDLNGQLARPDVQYLAPQVRVWWDPKYNYYVNRSNPADFLRDTQSKYAWLLPLVSEMHARGVPLLMGTDAGIPVALPGVSLHDELDDLIAAGLSPEDAINTATSNIESFVADHLPTQPGFGTIRVGNRADLILVAGNPLTNISHLRSIVGVMAAGMWYTRLELTDLLAEQTAAFNSP